MGTISSTDGIDGHNLQFDLETAVFARLSLESRSFSP